MKLNPYVFYGLFALGFVMLGFGLFLAKNVNYGALNVCDENGNLFFQYKIGAGAVVDPCKDYFSSLAMLQTSNYLILASVLAILVSMLGFLGIMRPFKPAPEAKEGQQNSL